MTDIEIAEAIGARQGLARAPLFRGSEIEAPEAHAVWLDGRHGSFVLSSMSDVLTPQAISWAWSTGTPHHVAASADEVAVTRWDAPGETRRFPRSAVLADPDRFYAHLHDDKVVSGHNIVRHCLDTFRSIRTLSFNSGLNDASALDIYLALLARLWLAPDGSRPKASHLDDRFDLPSGAADMLQSLPIAEVDDVTSRFLGNDALLGDLRALPRLAIRHASGEIFQEAHFELVARPSAPDLFARVPPSRGRKPNRGTVHFTPPYLARSLAEEAVRRIDGLEQRESLTVMDVACGSAAFLVEGLRALERAGYAGRIHVVGRDISDAAVNMARFVVGIAVREWPGEGRATVDIRAGDALRDPLPDADVVLMNPPFAVGQDIDPDIRELVRSLSGVKGGHLDLSMGFVSVAARAVRPGGALATLLPAKLLEAPGSARWRGVLAEAMGVSFRATFDHLRLFSHAMVRVGALVLTNGDGGTVIDLKVGAQDGSAGEALRALRRMRGAGFASVKPGADWAFRSGRSITDGTLPRSTTDERMAEGTATVTDLFEVLQGVRPGGSKVAFVRTQEEFDRLPAPERTFYRRAITNKGIVDGLVTRYVYVFYPYADNRPAFQDEADLRAAVPETYLRYLRPMRERLSVRGSKTIQRWWHLTHRGRGIIEKSPLLVSKFFASPGGFALDIDAVSLVEQGHALNPKPRLQEAFRRLRDGSPPDIALAYLAILNSDTFFRSVRRHSDGMVVTGGQLDISGRHLANVPLVDLSTVPDDIAPLARYARVRYWREDAKTGYVPSREEIEDWITEALARARKGSPFPAGQRDGGLPEWATLLMDRDASTTDRAYYVDIIEHLQMTGDTEEAWEIDDVLDRISTAAMSERALNTLVRTTFAFKERLPHWTAFRDRVEDELTKRGEIASEILVGLQP